MKLTCETARELYSPAYDGELSQDESALFGAHLDACEDCRGGLNAYREALEGLGARLHAEMSGQHPQQPFPSIADKGDGWSAWSRLLGVAQAVLAVVLLVVLVTAGSDGPNWEPGSPQATDSGAEWRPTAPVELAVLTTAVPVAGAACPWYEAEPQAIMRSISYPVLADDCLDQRYELVEARFQADEPEGCLGDVHLTYASGAGHLVLEQRLETMPACCHGEAVPLGASVGCVEHREDGVTSIRWSQERHAFHLHGDVPLDDGLTLARSLSEKF